MQKFATHFVCDRVTERIIQEYFATFRLRQGYGENSQKTSTVPQEMKSLEGIYIHQVACGLGHTLLLARNTSDEDNTKLKAIPEFTP